MTKYDRFAKNTGVLRYLTDFLITPAFKRTFYLYAVRLSEWFILLSVYVLSSQVTQEKLWPESALPGGPVTLEESRLVDALLAGPTGVYTYEGEPFSGKAIAYYENGQQRTLREFRDGMNHGAWKEWYPNGKLKQVRNFEQNEALGNWIKYSQDGSVYDTGDDDHLFYTTFFAQDVVPEGYESTSPSFTASGDTLVLALYREWEQKSPYIAYRKEDTWELQRLSFTDTLYNLAINPEGNRIVYKQYDEVDGEKVSRVFVVDKKEYGWEDPVEVKTLFNLNAGYFHFTPDNTLYFFARSPRTGIYYSQPGKARIYKKPRWLSDQVGLADSDSFDVFMHPGKKKLIISQYYNQDTYPDRGEVGLYYYEKKGRSWERVKRLPLSYGWGPTILSGRRFVFVRKGGIQTIDLKELGINW
ncbi:toxin-antitoxin system YwqK family antitoxin [Muriicola marianensis]|uniref:Toxin-antitoxin system YwqK family antitoxin n=1 Tax=Muriicola marianensis TaxID=1324801 RepID=A0ABQ1QT52_9FLAO|nr:hypothetical protein [Muriicola marianensis]GGD40153.1 hypothetical protein GCM10011361_04080 [Muriicola marianensis]